MYIVVITISDGNYTTPDKIDITIYQKAPLQNQSTRWKRRVPLTFHFRGSDQI